MTCSLLKLGAVACGLVTGLLGCAHSLEPDATSDSGLSGGVTSQVTVDGVVEMVIDATSEEDWVPYSFVEADVVDVGDHHVSFQRYRQRLAPGVAVARVAGADLDEPVDLDALLWLTDADEPVEDADYAMHEWYDYDPSNHTLSPKDERYVYRLGDDGASGYVVLVIDDYYDDAGTPARVSMRWTALEAR